MVATPDATAAPARGCCREYCACAGDCTRTARWLQPSPRAVARVRAGRTTPLRRFQLAGDRARRAQPHRFPRPARRGAACDACIAEYADAIRDRAIVNIFCGDLLSQNFSVTHYGRVVFYDHDEFEYLTADGRKHSPALPALSSPAARRRLVACDAGGTACRSRTAGNPVIPAARAFHAVNE
ncbi:MAG: isocitrate dehydrogenase kinase/phosphatase-domain containing protein [Casimicrobiaceae bacterium]